MKNQLLLIATTATLLSFSKTNFGQAPTLGVASTFAVFTAAGQFDNTGTGTYVTGDVGTFVGAFNAFPPGTVAGQIHVADLTSSQAATDVDNAYGQLSTVTCGPVLGVTLGNNQVLTPNVYCIGAASTLNGNLILDGQGDPNALFIIKINGTLSTSTNASVTLIDSASLCNVYWQINGAFTLGDNSVFRGTLLVNGAIHLLEGSTLLGRVLSRAGAIDLHNNVVAVGTQPIATITAGSSATFCAGGSVILSAAVTNGIAPYSYLWNSGQTTSSITVSPTITTTYKVAVTALNSCKAGINTFVVTVNPLPIITAGANPSTVCAGSSATLTGGGATSYVWTGGVTNGIGFVPSSTSTYTVTGTDANGCSNTATTTITVVPTPTVTANASATTLCAGGAVTLTGAGATSYVWTGGVTNGVSFVPSSTSTYTVTGTDANSCSNTAATTITVVSTPTITANASATTVCAGGSVTLTGAGATSYVWTGGVTNGIGFIPSSTNTYTVTGTVGSCTASDVITVTVIPFPAVNLGNDTTVTLACAGFLTLDAGNSGATYLWSTGATTQPVNVFTTGTYFVDVTNSGGCMASDTIYVVINGTFPLNLGPDVTVCGCIILNSYISGATSYAWCNGGTYPTMNVCTTGVYCVTVSNGICIVSDTIQITVLQPAVVNLGNDTTVATNLVLNAGSTNVSFLWNTGATTQMITVTSTGTYSVIVTAANGCTTSDTIIVSVLNGIAENISADFHATVYPNPSNNNGFTLSFDIAEKGNVEIKIMNVLGLVIYSEKLENFKGEYRRKVILRNSVTGIYFAEILKGDRRNTIKLILE